MKNVMLFVLSVFGVFYLERLISEGNLFALYAALFLGVVFIGWVGKQIWGDR